jgi:NAD(P)H-hydrate epimerase
VKAAAAEQMRKIDKEASALYGIPGIVLMENAGYGVYQEVMKMAGEGSKKVCIVCGRGNNGGDGFAAARHLSFTDNHFSIFLIGSGNELKGDALVNYTVCKNMGLDIKYIKSCDDLEKLKDSIRDSGIIVDAVLGTGVHGEVTGLYRNVIDIINEYAPCIVR